MLREGYCECQKDTASNLDCQWEYEHERLENVLFLSDCNHIAFSGQNESGLLDAKTGEPDYFLPFNPGRICSSKLISSGQVIALSKAMYIQLYGAQKGSTRWWLRNLSGIVGDIAFSPNDQILAVVCYLGIKLLDPESCHEIHRIDCPIDGHTELDRIAFSPDGKFLASSLHDNTIRLWDINVNKRQSTRYTDFSRPQVTTISNCGEFVALISPFETSRLRRVKAQLYIWDTQNVRMMYTFSLTTKGKVENMILSPNAQFIALQWAGQRYDLFDCKSGRRVVHSDKVEHGGDSHIDYQLHVFSPDSKLHALRTIDGIIQIWDTQSFAIIHEIRATSMVFPVMAFSLDSKRIAVTATDDHLHIFDLEAGAKLSLLKGNFNHTKYLNFLSKGQLLVFQFPEYFGLPQILLLDDRTGTLLRVIKLRKFDIPFQFPGQYQFKSFPTAGIFLFIINWKICDVWDLETGSLRRSFRVAEEIKDIHLLPCKAHLRMTRLRKGKPIYSLSLPDSSSCCSDTVSIDGFWIKRGDERLVYIPQDYISNLIAVRCKGASFGPFSGVAWGRPGNSHPINTLKFDFSMDEGLV